AASSTCRQLRMKTASAEPVNASVCSRNAPLTPIASKHCCTAKASAMPNHSIGHSSPALPTCAPVTGARYRRGCGKREHERLCVVVRQIKELEAKNRAELRTAQPSSPEARITQLIDLKGVGPIGGQGLVNEVFYRDFDNRRQVGSYFGLA